MEVLEQLCRHGCNDWRVGCVQVVCKLMSEGCSCGLGIRVIKRDDLMSQGTDEQAMMDT